MGDDGSRFQFEITLPSIDDKDDQQAQHGAYTVWNLQVEIEEQIRHQGKIVKQYSWRVGFSLPIKPTKPPVRSRLDR